MSQATATNKGYLPAVDGLRAFSIMGVLAYHGLTFLKPVYGGSGWLGVDVFFVISGFLITRLAIKELQRTARLDFKRFYWHRVLRIAPAFYFILAFYALVNPFSSAVNTRAVALAAAYLTDYDVGLGWGNAISAGLAFCWSLSVEEKFYFLFPFIMFAYTRWRTPLVFASIFVLCQAWKAYVISGNPEWLRLSGPFDTRFDAILAGCLAASCFDKTAAVKCLAGPLQFLARPGVVPALFAILWFWLYHFIRPMDPQGQLARCVFWLGMLPGFSLLTALFLSAMVQNHDLGKADLVARTLSLPPLVWLGRISYSLYLWHGFAFFMVAQVSPLSGLPQQLLEFAAALVFAGGSYYIIERPFLALKKAPPVSSVNRASAAAEKPLVLTGASSR